MSEKEKFARLLAMEHELVTDQALDVMQLPDEVTSPLMMALWRTYLETKKEPHLVEDITDEEHRMLCFQGAAMTAFWAGWLWRGMKDAEASEQ